MLPMPPVTLPLWLALTLRVLVAVVDGITRFFRAFRTVAWGITCACIVTNWALCVLVSWTNGKGTPKEMLIHFVFATVFGIFGGWLVGHMRERGRRQLQELRARMRQGPSIAETIRAAETLATDIERERKDAN